MTPLFLLAQTAAAPAASPTAEPAARTFAELMADMPLGATGVLAAALCIGLILLIFGNLLAKKGVMLCGLVIGGLGAVGAATQLSGAEAPQGSWLLAFGIGGAIAGVMIAWLLFRFWMAASAAVVLAAVVPLSAMIWEGNGPELSSLAPAREAAEAAWAAVDPAATDAPPATPGVAPPEAPPAAADTPAPEAKSAPATLLENAYVINDIQGVYEQQAEEIRVWWGELPAASKLMLQLGAAIGACCGLVLGLAAPLIAAAIQSALLGACLVFTGVRGLILAFAPSVGGVLPAEWRGVLLTIGLITLLGLLIQWAMRQRDADVAGKA